MAKGSDTRTLEHEEARDKSPSREGWPRWTGFKEKTFWDWLQLLVVPLMLAGLGFLFTTQQDAQQQATDQDAKLQADLDQMSTLLIDENLRGSDENSEVRTLARAQTLTVLEGSDPERRTQILRFLMDAELG